MMPASTDVTTTGPWARALAFTATLRGGARITVRPITAGDRARIAAALESMSARTRYMRFHSVRNGLTDDELRYLTELDYERHVAWGAVAEDEPGRPGIAAARFIRETADAKTAECALTVVDAWQSRGLGTLLLRTLLVSAAERDLKVLVGTVLPENTAALRLAARFDARMEQAADGSVLVEIPVRPAHRSDRMSGTVLRLPAG